MAFWAVKLELKMGLATNLRQKLSKILKSKLAFKNRMEKEIQNSN